jgi:TolA-binding protein
MKRSILVTFFITFLPFTLLGAEPSAFGAGDLSNPKPYGLTTSEEVVLQNKKKLQKVVVTTNNQANRVDSLRERLDGLQSIVESLSRKSQENKKKIKKIDEVNSKALLNSDEYEKRLSEVSQNNSKEIQTLKTVVSQLSTLLDDINKKYVTKDELNGFIGDFNQFKELVATELKKVSSSKKSTLQSMSNAKISKEAYRFYKKKYYTKSIEYYSYLISKKYKPAFAHYMIGEMNYRRKNYAQAISYYKKSASLYPKASYMPSLMLHTARSMQVTGDKKNAKTFYEALIAKYSASAEAKSAKKYLTSMK